MALLKCFKYGPDWYAVPDDTADFDAIITVTDEEKLTCENAIRDYENASNFINARVEG